MDITLIFLYFISVFFSLENDQIALCVESLVLLLKLRIFSQSCPLKNLYILMNLINLQLFILSFKNPIIYNAKKYSHNY